MSYLVRIIILIKTVWNLYILKHQVDLFRKYTALNLQYLELEIKGARKAVSVQKEMSTKNPTKKQSKQQRSTAEQDLGDLSLDKTLQNFWSKYSVETHPRIKLIDWFIVYLVLIMAIQFFYRLVVGDDFPKNAFLTGMFCPLGVIVLLLELRKSEKKNFRRLAEFFLASVVLFLVSINFIG